MWHTPDGDRVLTAGEWSLVRAGLEIMWDAVEAAREAGHDQDVTGVRAFDAFQSGQQLGLLALVGRALTDPAMPAPLLTAATEGALAGVFELLRAWLEVEHEGAGSDGDSPYLHRLIVGAVGKSEGRDTPLPGPTEAEPGEWELLLDEVKDRLFWDADYALGDVFLDLPPDAGREMLEQRGIDPDYFLDVPDDPDDVGLAAARQTLGELTGRPGRAI